MSRPGAILRDGAAERQPVPGLSTEHARGARGRELPRGLAPDRARPQARGDGLLRRRARGRRRGRQPPPRARREARGPRPHGRGPQGGGGAAPPRAWRCGRRWRGRGRAGAEAQASQLLRAFRFDARGGRVETWEDLLGYCEDSANPVGRFLLDLHGEGPEGRPASDALCTALQVLNHLQDLRDDHLLLARRYLPGRWMREEGARDEDLGGAAMTPALRRVADRALDATDALLREGARLPRRLRSRRLGGEAAAIHRLACGLASRLRRADPLAGPVKLSRLDFALAGAAGAWHLVAPRARALP